MKTHIINSQLSLTRVRLKSILTFIILFALGTTVMAQHGGSASSDRPGRTEKLESMKIAFITEKLNLTPDEAKVFWPVYNGFQDEIEKLRKGHRESLMDAKDNFDKLSDKDIEKLVDNEIIFRQNELDVVKKYQGQFKQVIPVRKVAKLYRLEEEWKRKVLDMWRERKDEKMGRE